MGTSRRSALVLAAALGMGFALPTASTTQQADDYPRVSDGIRVEIFYVVEGTLGHMVNGKADRIAPPERWRHLGG